MNNKLKENFKDWVDFDIAMHALSLSFGIINEKSLFQDYKKIYWSSNIYSDELTKIIYSLIKIGFFLFDEDEQKVKYNVGFKLDTEA